MCNVRAMLPMTEDWVPAFTAKAWSNTKGFFWPTETVELAHCKKQTIYGVVEPAVSQIHIPQEVKVWGIFHAMWREKGKEREKIVSLEPVQVLAVLDGAPGNTLSLWLVPAWLSSFWCCPRQLTSSRWLLLGWTFLLPSLICVIRSYPFQLYVTFFVHWETM